MKRFIVAAQILLATLFIVKILFLTEILPTTALFPDLSLEHFGQAIAETTIQAKPTAVTPVKDIAVDSFQKERDLLILLKEKQKELDARETTLKAEETKITALKMEVMEKIDALKILENKLAAQLDSANSNEMKRLKDMAKVYEASPPQKAAAMLEKMDIKTAAGITINMKRDRAGLVWGYLSPLKAVEITNEITKTIR